MTTNIDAAKDARTDYERKLVGIVESQQKRIEELEREAESTISQLRQVQVRMNYWHDRTGEAEAKLSAVRQAVAQAKENMYPDLPDSAILLHRKDWLSLLSTVSPQAVKDAPAQQPEQGE